MSRLLNVDILSIVLLCGILLLTIAISSCSKQKQVVLKEEPSIKEIQNEALLFARTTLGPTAKVTPNQSSTYFLVTRVEEPRTTFLVTDRTNNIVYKKKSINGTVKWISNTSLVYQDLPRVMEDRSSKPSDFNQIIELKESN